jgi:hypothetical protein
MFPDFYPTVPPSDASSTGWASSGMAWRGESSTPSYSTFRSGEGGPSCSRRVGLVDVLEPNAAPQYWVSARAAAGILRRAERSEIRELSELLRQELLALLS